MKSRIVLFAFCVALLSSCGNKGNDTGKVPEYAVQELQKTTANLTTAYPATIKGKQDVEIRPQVSGFITKLCVDEGAAVRKGQVLFIVDPTQYEAAVRTAKAAVATAEAAVSTQQMTYDNKKELNKSKSSVTMTWQWQKTPGTDQSPAGTSKSTTDHCSTELVIHTG